MAKKTNCGQCNNSVGKKAKALQCEICEKWFHTTCEGINDKTYELITEDSSSGTPKLHWYCTKTCSDAVSKYIVRLSNLEEQVQKLTSRIERMEKGELSDQLVEAVKKVASECQPKQTVLDNQAQGQAKEQELTEKITSQGVKEVQERERRKANLVWFGITENNSEDVAVRTKADKKKVEDICSDTFGEKIETVSCKRLGRRDKDVKGARPLLITLQDDTQVRKILKEARKLRDKEENNGIYVKKDSTPLERANLKRLLEIRNQRRENTKQNNGTEIWVIRNEEVVDISKKPTYAEALTKAASNSEETSPKRQN